MHGISADDRLWLVKRDQDARRQAATADRMAGATRRGGAGPLLQDAAVATPHSGSALAWRILHALSGHRLAHRVAAH